MCKVIFKEIHQTSYSVPATRLLKPGKLRQQAGTRQDGLIPRKLPPRMHEPCNLIPTRLASPKREHATIHKAILSALCSRQIRIHKADFCRARWRRIIASSLKTEACALFNSLRKSKSRSIPWITKSMA